MKSSNVMSGIGKFFTWILLYCLTIFVKGTVITFLWNWFIAPLGVVPISFWVAFGISLVVSVFLPQRASTKTEDVTFKKQITDFCALCATYLLFWGMGAIIHLFV